jgi:predicted RNase H-like nuclease (RuvC/YqgF family)
MSDASQEPKPAAPAAEEPAAAASAAPPAAANDDAAAAEQKRKVEERIAQLTARRDALKADVEQLKKDNAEVEKTKSALADARRQHAEVEKETAAVEEKIALLQPEYDRAMANRDLLERRDACKRDIDAIEAKLQRQQEENAALEAELERVSAKYKETRELRAALVSQATELLDALKQQVEVKLRDTIDSPDVTGLNAFELLELLTDLVGARERELNNNSCLLREVEAAIAIKKETAARLESDSEKAVNDKRRERAETIKRMIYGFQEERNTLQADIEEVRRVNEEQAANLLKGHVNAAVRDRDVFSAEKELLSPSGRRMPPKRVTVTRSDAAPTAEERMIAEKNAEAERELGETVAKVTEATRNKTELAKQQKSVKLQIAADQAAAENRLRELESQVVSEVERVRKLNAENARLADAVKHLTDLVRITKQQVERIRGHTAPLPIEQD